MVFEKKTSTHTENDLPCMEGRPSENNGSEPFNQFDKTHLEVDEKNLWRWGSQSFLSHVVLTFYLHEKREVSSLFALFFGNRILYFCSFHPVSCFTEHTGFWVSGLCVYANFRSDQPRRLGRDEWGDHRWMTRIFPLFSGAPVGVVSSTNENWQTPFPEISLEEP